MDTVAKIAAIEARMARGRKADEVKRQKAKHARWLAGAPARKERNRQAQADYRQRRAEDLLKARRVATALMSLRRDRPTSWLNTPPRGFMVKVAAALRAFLTAAELANLQKELGKN